MRDLIKIDGYFVWRNQVGDRLKPYKLHINIEEKNFALHSQDLISLVRHQADGAQDSVAQFKCVDIQSEKSKNLMLFIEAYRLLYAGLSTLGDGDKAGALCASLDKLSEISGKIDDDRLNQYVTVIQDIKENPEIIESLDQVAVMEDAELVKKNLQLWERAVGRGQLTLYFCEDADEMAIVEFCRSLEVALRDSELQATPAEQGPPQFDLGLSSFLSLRLDTDEHGNYIGADQLEKAEALQSELERLPIYLELKASFEFLDRKFRP